MSIQAVGFEGDLPETTTVTWGAAALLVDDDRIINSVTGTACSVERLAEFVSQQTVFRIEPVDLEPSALQKTLFVVVVRHNSVGRKVMDDAFAKHALAHSHGNELDAYVMETDRDLGGPLELGIDQAIDRLVAEAIKGSEHSSELIRCGLILNPHHPELNAVRVAQAEASMQDRIMSLASACVKSEHRDRFERMLLKLGLLISATSWRHLSEN